MTQLQRLEDIEIRREAVDAAELIGALQETAGILCGDKTLLSYDTVEGGSFRLDEEAVSQVFENLLSNAVRYAEQKIEITFRTSAQFFCIEVSDDGAGFSCCRTGAGDGAFLPGKAGIWRFAYGNRAQYL